MKVKTTWQHFLSNICLETTLYKKWDIPEKACDYAVLEKLNNLRNPASFINLLQTTL